MKRHQAYKIELKPTVKQIKIIENTMGVCRYVYNLFVATNRENYTQDNADYMNGYEFSKWLNNKYRADNPDKLWIWEASSKSVKKSIMNADTAYRNFMKGSAGFPKFKKRNGRPVSMYLPRNNLSDLKVERHKGKIPTLGWVRFKEYGYVPYGDQSPVSVTIIRNAGRYYASFLFEIEQKKRFYEAKTEGIGIDLGIKNLAVISDGRKYQNINKTNRVRKLTKRLKREIRKFSRKIQIQKQRKEETVDKKCKRSNLDKQRLKLQRAYKKLSNVRRDCIRKTINEIVKVKPEFITIEDLNVRGMMKNRHLSRKIASCEFYYFRSLLEQKSRENGIELRIANRFYASSKKCSQCGKVKKDLKLSDRIYECEHCGQVMDRDYNAAVNLRDCEKYKVV